MFGFFIIMYWWMESSKLCYIIRSFHSLLNTTFSVSMGFLFAGVYRMFLTIRIPLLKIILMIANIWFLIMFGGLTSFFSYPFWSNHLTAIPCRLMISFNRFTFSAFRLMIWFNRLTLSVFRLIFLQPFNVSFNLFLNFVQTFNVFNYPF